MERKMEKVFCNISDKEHRSNRFNSWYFTPLFFCLNKKKRGLRDVVEESQASFIYKKKCLPFRELEWQPNCRLFTSERGAKSYTRTKASLALNHPKCQPRNQLLQIKIRIV